MTSKPIGGGQPIPTDGTATKIHKKRSSFKSKFKFKNGLKGFKKKSKNIKTTSPASTSTSPNLPTDNNPDDNPPDTIPPDGGGFYYIPPETKNGKKKKKKKRAKLPKILLKDYKFPSTILAPQECWSLDQYNDADKQLHKYLETKYSNQIKQLTFFPKDILIRFTISQRGIKSYTARLRETEKQFAKYLKYHREFHYDDILTNTQLNTPQSLSSLQSDMNALPLFLYGMDKQGHPIFWDDGSAYSKSSNLDMFKKDMGRVQIFRSRLMKRMHNIKLATSKKYNFMVYKHCLVMDLSKFNAKKFVKDRKFHEQNTKDISDLFPEVLHRLYIINTPWAFRSAWKIIQGFLHPITVEKTKILGKDYIDELVKDIYIEQIPYKFGGQGPYTVMYGEGPLSYPIKTKDVDWDYNLLPKNTLPVPKREQIPVITPDDQKTDDNTNNSKTSTPRNIAQTKLQHPNMSASAPIIKNTNNNTNVSNNVDKTVD